MDQNIDITSTSWASHESRFHSSGVFAALWKHQDAKIWQQCYLAHSAFADVVIFFIRTDDLVEKVQKTPFAVVKC